jgi:alpha-tubulin suppressor-like RCC1 family protein
VTLNKGAAAIYVGDSETLLASVQPANASNKALTWSTSDPAVATVTADGLVTAVATGVATISATSVDGGHRATCDVTLNAVHVTGVTLNKTTTVLVVGRTDTLVATPLPANATDKTVTWSSDSPAVATVANGLVRALSPGRVTITATTVDQGLTATCLVTVKASAQASSTFAAGANHIVAIKADGSLWAWGKNESGQLGDGTQTDRALPTRVGTDTDWVSVTAGKGHSVAIKADGSLWTWGFNGAGECGTDPNLGRMWSDPKQMGADRDWAQVSAYDTHTLAIKTDGSIWGWGGASGGVLGIGPITNPTGCQYYPARAGFDTDWATVSTGMGHTIALKTDGSLWAWGRTYAGGLGGSLNDTVMVPTRVGTEKDWLFASAGYYCSHAIKADGSLWGCGNYDLVGNGGSSQQNETTLVRVGTDMDWALVSHSMFYWTSDMDFSIKTHGLALKTDGSLWVWGDNNSYGQHGNGTTALPPQSTRPHIVGADRDWDSLALSCPSGVSFAMKQDGSLWAWGDNQHGQLGDGKSVSRRTTPGQVGTAKDWAR